MYLSLFNHMPSAAAVYRTSDGGETFVFDDINPAAENVERLSRASVLGRRVDEVFPGAEKMGIIGALRRVWKTGQSEYLPISMYSDKRSPKSWRENWLYKNIDGSVVTIYRDVTDRIRLEDETLRQKNLLRCIIDRIPYAIFWKDLSSKYLGCNTPFCQAAGLVSPNEIIGKSDHELPWASQADAYIMDDGIVLKTGVPIINREREQLISGGGKINILINKMPLRDTSGDIIGVLGIYADISERKKMEKELTEIAREWQTTFDASSDMIMFLDPDMKIMRANLACEVYLRKPLRSIIGKHCYQLFHETDEPADACPVIRARDTNLSHAEETLYFKDRDVWINVSIDVVRRENGELVGYVHTMRDITESKRSEIAINKAYDELKLLQTELIQSEKMAAIGRLSSGIAHEVKNPLAVIIGCAEFLSHSGHDLDAESSDAVEKIKDAALRANSTLVSLLQFARPAPFKASKTQAQDLVRGIVSLFDRDAKKCRIEIITKLPLEPISIMVDRNLMHQVIFNLMKNAIEAMSQGGTLSVSAYKAVVPELTNDFESCVVEIIDTGPGIPKHNIEKIAEPFFSTKERVSGTGLGLYMVRSILTRHGGKLLIDSVVGKGTAMKVVLPIARDRTEDMK